MLPRLCFVLSALTSGTMKALLGSERVSAGLQRQGVREPKGAQLINFRSSRPGLGLPISQPARGGMPLYASTGISSPGVGVAIQEDVEERRMGRQHFRLEGPVFALVNPFRPGNLRFDDDSFVKYLEYLWNAGARNVIVNGTTGEFPSMTMEERMHVTDLAREHWPGVIINNVSATAVLDARRLLEHSCQTSPNSKGGETVALLLPPYYYQGAAEPGIERWLHKVLESARQPVYLYNFPQHTGNLISPELFQRLARDFPLVRGIKNSFDDLELCKQYKAAVPDRQVYMGFDESVLDGLDAGLDGAVGIGVNAAMTEAFVGVAESHKRGDMDAAREGVGKVLAWAEQQRQEGVVNIPAAKAVLSSAIDGFPVTVRAPLLYAAPEQKDRLSSFFFKA